jgi:hypothetical protein
MAKKVVTPKPGLFPEGTAVEAFDARTTDVERREGRVPGPSPAASGVIKEGQVELTAEPGSYVLVGVVDEVQSLKVDATAGKYKLKFEGQTTADIKFNATAKEVEEALVALSNIAAGDVEVSGGVGNSGGTKPYVVKFLGAYAGTNVPTLEVAAGSEALSGGGAAATVSTTTAGSKAGEGGREVTCLFHID